MPHIPSPFPLGLGGFPLGGERTGFRLYDAVIEPIRKQDAAIGNELLRRFMIGSQMVHDQLARVLLDTANQLNPSTVRDDLVQWLKDIVGFTSELNHITLRLDETKLRKVIALAVPMWNERHTEAGIANLVRLLTGKTANITNWFGFRSLLGETMIGEDQLSAGGDSWIIGGATSQYDENWSNIRIMDDGTLDEQLLVDLIRLERPSQERVELALVDFLAKYQQPSDVDLYTVTAGATPEIVDANLVIAAGTELEPITPILPTRDDHVDYVLITKFKLAATSEFRVRWYFNEVTDDYYELVVKLAPTRCTLSRVVAGAPTVIGTSNAPTVGLAADTFYKLRIQTQNDGNDRVIKVYLDNIVVFELTDVTAGAPDAGPVRLAAVTDDVILDNTESWRIPLRYATITLSTLTERGGELTSSDGFFA